MRAAFKDMVGGATEHTPLEADGKGALKISNRVNGIAGCSAQSWLILLHGLLGWGHERASESRNVAGVTGRLG